MAVAACAALTGSRSLAGAADTANSNSDARFVDQLAHRRLYRLADDFSRNRLLNTDQSSRRRAEVAAAWIRSKAQQAMEAPPQRRDEAWGELDEAAGAFRAAGAAGADEVLVDLQIALAHLLRGRLQRENARFRTSEVPSPRGRLDSPGADNDNMKIETARASIRQAIDRIRDVGQRLDALLTAAYRERADAGANSAWTIRELESLRRRTALTTAEAYEQQALCYGAESPDRLNALSLAIEKLNGLTLLQESEPSLAWEARVQHVRCLRLLRRFDRCSTQLEEWLEREPPASTHSELIAEQVRLLCDRGEFPEALKLGIGASKSAQDGLPGPGFDDAVLEALIGVRNAAQGEQREALTDRAAQWTRQIAARHGPYWHRRAEARLGAAIAEGAETDDAQLLASAAKNLYAGGRHREAVDLYDRIAQLEAEAGATEAALDASATAAAILEENGELASALSRRLKLARELAGHPRAAEIHLAAAATAAELTREASATEQSERLAQYVELLDQQIRRWPEAPATQTARWWLARYLMSVGQWNKALSQLEQVAPASPFYPDAVRGRLDCYRAKLTALGDGQPSSANRHAELAAEATSRLHAVIAGADNQLPRRWTDLQRQVAVELAAMQLEYFPTVRSYSEGILRAALADAEDVDPAWLRRANLLQAAAAARLGNADAAERLLGDASLDPEEALLLARCLRIHQPSSGAANDASRLLGQIALQAIRSASTPNGASDPAERRQLQRWEAAALAASGDRAAALAAYDRLTAAHPVDGDLAAARAKLLASGTADQRRQALSAYRGIELRSKPGGGRWLQARRARINLLSNLGRQQQADQLARLTAVLYPQSEHSAGAGDGAP